MKEKIKLEKKLQQKIAVIEHREPIISVLEEKGVKAAYMESQKRKRIEDEELQQAKKAKVAQVNSKYQTFGNINYCRCFF